MYRREFRGTAELCTANFLGEDARALSQIGSQVNTDVVAPRSII